MEQLLNLVPLGFAVTAFTELIKQIKKGKEININFVISFLLGQAIAWTINIDFLESAGHTVNQHFVGYALTGLALTGGGNFIFNLTKKRETQVEVVEVAEMTDGIGYEE